MVPKTVESVAQVRDSARQPYAGAARQSDHRVAANTSRNIPTSTIPHTRTILFERSISIEPSVATVETRTAANFAEIFSRFETPMAAACRRRHAVSKFADTVLFSNLVDGCPCNQACFHDLLTLLRGPPASHLLLRTCAPRTRILCHRHAPKSQPNCRARAWLNLKINIYTVRTGRLRASGECTRAIGLVDHSDRANLRHRPLTISGLSTPTTDCKNSEI
jgi:hypothetical protein